jgi:hypothetical protein
MSFALLLAAAAIVTTGLFAAAVYAAVGRPVPPP